MDEPRAEGRCAPFPAPVLGDAAAPSHFPLGPLLAFQAAAFSIVNLETEKEADGLGRPRRGNRSRSAARPFSVRCPVSPNPRPSQARSPAHHGAPPPACPAPSRLPLPAPKPGANLAGQGVRTRGQTAAPLREERGPCGEGGRGPRGGRSPQEPSPPGSPPASEEPRLVSVSSASPSEPKLSPAPPRGSSSGPGACLQTAGTGHHRHPGQTEKLSPTEGQFTA